MVKTDSIGQKADLGFEKAYREFVRLSWVERTKIINDNVSTYSWQTYQFGSYAAAMYRLALEEAGKVGRWDEENVNEVDQLANENKKLKLELGNLGSQVEELKKMMANSQAPRLEEKPADKKKKGKGNDSVLEEMIDL